MKRRWAYALLPRVFVVAVPNPVDYEQKFEEKRRMLRSGVGLTRGKNIAAIGPETRLNMFTRAARFLVAPVPPLDRIYTVGGRRVQ